MPDFNKYAADVPYVRPELPKTGLSLIVKPAYDYVNTFPELPQAGNGEVDFSFLNAGEKNPFAHLGQVPIAPAASTPYNIASRYNNPDLMFLPSRDNEDLYAKNQGVFSSIGSGLGRVVLTAGTKLGTGIGFLAGLMGIDNKYENYDNGFSGWIAGAADNGLKQWFQNAEDETIKKDWLPIYQEAADKDKGFFRRAATDLNFWTDDVADLLAFTASTFVPGMTISKLGLGTTFLKNAAYLSDLTATTEEAALSSEGLAGGVESANALAKGATTASEAAAQGGAAEGKGLTYFSTPGAPGEPGVGTFKPAQSISPTVKTTEKGLQELPRVFKWIDNAKLARSIDVGATSVINTASGAMFAAEGVKNELINKLSKERNPDGSFKYTPEQVKLLAAKGAKDTFLMNLGALSMSELWEANLMFKPLASRAGKLGEEVTTKGLWDEATLQKKVFGQKMWERSHKALEGIAIQGFWGANIQQAVNRLNESDENFDLSFGGKLAKLIPSYIGQTFSALSGGDTEAAVNIGIGSLVGMLTPVITKKLGLSGEPSKEERLKSLNTQVSFFKGLGNIYEADANGHIKLNEHGSPVVDMEKFRSYLASMNKVLNMQEVARNLEGRGVDELTQLYKDEIFARYAKAHFDNGLGELLHKRLDDIKNISPDDMILLGFDPSSKDGTLDSRIQKYKDHAVQLEKLYDNIQRNYLPLRKDKQQKKFYDITDKIYYMSARTQSLAEQVREAKSRYDEVHGNVDGYNAEYNKQTDQVINEYNQKFENLQAAKRAIDIAYERERAIRELNKPVEETRRGVSVSGPSKLERLKKENPAVAISLPTNFVEQSEELVNNRQKELDDFVKSNKEVLERMKKDSRGRYMYEIANKNSLPAAKKMERLQTVQSELNLAHDNTMKSVSRLADLNYGEKYYNKVYAPAIERQIEKIQNEGVDEDPEDIATEQDDLAPKSKPTETVLNDDEINKAFEQAKEDGEVTENKKDVVEHIANKLEKGQELTNKEEEIRKVLKDDIDNELERKKEKSTISDTFEREAELNKEKDALEKIQNRTDDQDQKLDDIYKELDALEERKNEQFDEFDNELKVGNSNNIKPEDKPKYQEVLNEISKNKKRVVKYDDHYEIDGERYGKVTDVINDVIPDDVRAKVQNAVNAGYTMDTIAKAFFEGTANEEFRNGMADKISEEAYDNAIKKLQKIKDDLKNKGIEIVGSNVLVFDKERKIAGEIDLLGVDKNGNFKIYEIQARKPEVYRMYGLRGRGIKIRELDQQRLSAYRNMFANQYGVVPDEIAVKFPFEVKYDKESPKGYIESVNTKKEIRFTPSRDVQIKRKVFEPIRIGSKFDNIDLLRIFSNTFLPNEDLKAKVRFLMRNVPLTDIKNNMTVTIREAQPQFLQKYAEQQKVLDGHPTDYKLTKYKGFNNLYALSGNKEISVNYDGTLLGYMSPSKSLAYRDVEGNYHVLDENTDSKTYSEVTGNSEETFPEFKRIASAYSYAYNQLSDMLDKSEGKEVTLNNDQLKELYDSSLSYGEFDKVPTGEKRPSLSELNFNGVRVGKKQVTTVVHIDPNNNVMVMMDKVKRTDTTIKKYQDVDQWVNNNIDDITKAITNKEGRRTTEHVAIVELPNKEYRVVPLKLNKESKITNDEQFVSNLGDDFTAAVRPNVFKNESIMMIPKYKEETINFKLKDAEIANKVYKAEDIESLEKFGLSPADAQPEKHAEIVSNFYNDLTGEQKRNFDVKYGKEKFSDKILDDYNNSLGFGNLQDYLNYIKECKL